MNVRYFVIKKMEDLYSGEEKLLCTRYEEYIPRIGDTLVFDGMFRVVDVCWCIDDKDTTVEITVIEG
jgi:hypothetical protein